MSTTTDALDRRISKLETSNRIKTDRIKQLKLDLKAVTKKTTANVPTIDTEALETLREDLNFTTTRMLANEISHAQDLKRTWIGGMIVIVVMFFCFAGITSYLVSDHGEQISAMQEQITTAGAKVNTTYSRLEILVDSVDVRRPNRKLKERIDEAFIEKHF